jgi:hypothetical protein
LPKEELIWVKFVNKLRFVFKNSAGTDLAAPPGPSIVQKIHKEPSTGPINPTRSNDPRKWQTVPLVTGAVIRPGAGFASGSASPSAVNLHHVSQKRRKLSFNLECEATSFFAEAKNQRDKEERK